MERHDHDSRGLVNGARGIAPWRNARNHSGGKRELLMCVTLTMPGPSGRLPGGVMQLALDGHREAGQGRRSLEQTVKRAAGQISDPKSWLGIPGVSWAYAWS
jgi:hypothetical protein